MNADIRKILVLGASGLIGGFVTSDLRARGFRVVGVARKLPASQNGGALDLELPIMSMQAAQLARLLRDHHIDVVVNCLGVLQDGPGSDTAMVRSLAAFPLDLPAAERAAPFQPVAMEDIAATIAWLAARDPGEANAVTWDLMQEQPVTLGDVIDQFREVFGTGRWWRIVM